jgi:hypothetical protein
MFSFVNGPDTETVSNESEFIGDTLNIWDQKRDFNKEINTMTCNA